MSIVVCPACGYPTIGPELCFYCRPVAVAVGMSVGREAASADRVAIAPAEVSPWSM